MMNASAPFIWANILTIKQNLCKPLPEDFLIQDFARVIMYLHQLKTTTH